MTIGRSRYVFWGSWVYCPLFYSLNLVELKNNYPNMEYAGHLQNTHRMAFTKLGWFILDCFGFSTAFLGFITNLDNIKSAILAILGIVYMGVRMFYYIKQKEQALREKEYDLWDREHAKQEKLN